MSGEKTGFTKEQLAEFREQFDAVDLDGSNTVEASELKTVLEKCGQIVTDMQVQAQVKEFDADGDGALNFDEFVAMMWRMQSGPSEKEVRQEMFTMLDDNLDGFVTLEELRAFWMKASDESQGKLDVPSDAELKRMIAEADSDGDGKLHIDDFLNIVDQCV